MIMRMPKPGKAEIIMMFLNKRILLTERIKIIVSTG